MPANIKSTSSSLFVRFVSDGSVQKSGFSVNFIKGKRLFSVFIVLASRSEHITVQKEKREEILPQPHPYKSKTYTVYFKSASRNENVIQVYEIKFEPTFDTSSEMVPSPGQGSFPFTFSKDLSSTFG